MGIKIHFKEGNTIRSLLVVPKDKNNITQKSGVIYMYKYHRLECNEEYIWQSARTLGKKLKEHFRAPFPIYVHANPTGDLTSVDSFSIVGRESHNLTRTIKEAMYIRVTYPSFNHNIGKYHLSHIYDEVLFNTQDF